jgi:hypothetical protein
MGYQTAAQSLQSPSVEICFEEPNFPIFLWAALPVYPTVSVSCRTSFGIQEQHDEASVAQCHPAQHKGRENSNQCGTKVESIWTWVPIWTWITVTCIIVAWRVYHLKE